MLEPIVRTVFAIVIGMTFWGGIPANAAVACSCAPRDPAGDLSHAEAVFDGVVVRQALSQRTRTVLIRVRRVWKGSVARTVRVSTSRYGGLCGADFEVGQRYMVCASGRRRWFSTGLCTGTGALGDVSGRVQGLGTPTRRYGSQEPEDDERAEEQPSGPVEVMDEDPLRAGPRRID